MFQRKKRHSLHKALRKASDPELQDLERQIKERQERVARLELELSDTRSELARFEHELNRRLGPLQRRLEDLEQQIEDARRRAERRAMWGDRADSPDTPEDVVEQFRKTWAKKETPPKPPPVKQVSASTKAELKSLFRALAKRFHPDLATDPSEKRWRAGLMTKVNEAYAAQDLAALRALGEKPDWDKAAPVKTRAQMIADMRKEIRRLDGVIASLQRTLQQLSISHTVKLMLDVSMARRAGRDLLAEMAVDLQSEITILETELAELKSRL
jgi:hypothetical protein